MEERKNGRLIVLLGPTAVGKTSLAVQLASMINGEIISADSRQVYRDMDLGSGKDLSEYLLPQSRIIHHLIDIKDAGEKYDVFHFQRDFYKAYYEIVQKGKQAILCGGSGLYLEAALKKTQLIEVPKNEDLRSSIRNSTHDELKEMLLQLKPEQHNTTDLIDRERLIRAIEIATAEADMEEIPSPVQDFIIFGLHSERELLRERIKQRLNERLEDGMIDEVRSLIKNGVSKESLEYYGLEYRYIVKYLNEELNFDQMHEKLLQAIRQFAKKQMTWFRRMEKQGHLIHWINSEWELQKKLDHMMSKL